jgi:PAS domain S-box-containing protein
VYFTDRQQRYMYANPAALREFGLAAVAGVKVDHIVGRLEVLRADGTPRPLHEAPPLRALAGEVIRDEAQIVRIPRTGEWRYRQVSAAPVRDAAGEIIGSVSVVRDVTEERRALAQLHERAARSATLLQLGDEFQRLREPTELAAAAARTLGVALGASHCEYCAVEGDPGSLRLMARWCSETRNATEQSVLPTCRGIVELLRDGRTLVCADVTQDSGTVPAAAALQALQVAALIVVPILAQGRLGAALCITQSTPRIWSAEEVAFAREIAERTRLAVEHRQSEQALRLSEQQLREADQRKDEFLAVLAHELRNPLVPIRAGIDLLKDAVRRPSLLDTLRPMMQRQVQHMVRLIDDLLDVSRITSGKIQLQCQPVILGELIESAIESNRSAIVSGRLELRVRLDQPQLTLNVDPTRFTQILANLLQNAAKFTPGGGQIQIDSTVVAGDRAAGGRELTVTVADTGSGIAQEFLPHVFDLFAQSHAPGVQSGLGIGLTLARRLTELHGGTIEAYSDGPGRGSRFTVRLPLPGEMRTHATESATSAAPLPGTRVLIIDDNQDAADVMALLIEQLGGVTRAAYGGVCALQAVEEFNPQVVLLDLGMPDMDGYETCRRLRAQCGAGIGIAALSGWGQEQDKARTALAGFDAHLTKPAAPEELQRVLQALTRPRTARGERTP